MFTGLVEDVGAIVAVSPAKGGQGSRLVVQTRLPEADLFIGASVAVDGACLTVVEQAGGRFSADVSVETLQRTTLGERKSGDRVNLELPMALGDRLGGHLVLGHVDAVGRLISLEPAGEGVRAVVEVPATLGALVVEKGSIALDGISLTVNELRDEPGGATRVSLLLIPETQRATTWGHKAPGARINVEADILGKHVARLLSARASKGLDLAQLVRAGFATEHT